MRASNLLTIPALLIAVAAHSEPISLDAWFQGPRIEHLAISPDARYIAMIVKEGDHSIVMVKDRTTRDPAKPVIAADPETNMEAQTCGWSSGTRVVCRLAGMSTASGLGSYLSRLVAVDIDGGNRRVLLNKEANHGWSVIDYRTDEPETMLVSSGGAVATLNTKTGALHLQMRRNDDISYVQHDGDGKVLFAAGIPRTASRNKEVQYFARASNDDDWKLLKKLAAYANNPLIRLGHVIPGEKAAHIVFDHKGHTALFKIDLTDQRDPELVYWHEQRDVGTYIYDAAARLLGVGFESNSLGPQYIDPKMAALDVALRKKWPNRWNWVRGSSEDGKTFVVQTDGLSEPNGFYILDTSGQGVRFDLAGLEWPGFARMTLPTTIPALVRARNGRVIEALFTPAPDTAKKAPLVVFVDGTQKSGAFEPATYFLATRGYAVLRPYFSGGTVEAGWAHAPYQDWNGGLYDEIMDAVAWAAARPDVDASRICIVGRNNYGGYSALLAAARKGSPFVCAASLQGISDLEERRKDVAKAGRIEDERPTGTSDEQVAKDSPLRRAAEFHMPVLLVEENLTTHSARDDDDGREMAAALAAAGKPHKLLLIKEIDDSYLRAEYAELERFLAEQLRPMPD
jgi:alpha/beta superfamily hydrolase